MTNRLSMRARLMLGAVALCMPGIAHAGDLTGSVADATETRSLTGAEVTIVELGRTTQVDSNGNYRFADVPAGTYTLRATYVGAAPVEVSVTVTETGTVVQNLALGQSGSDILVIGQKANLFGALSMQRSADGVSSVLTRDAVGQFPDQNVSEALRRLPGINILDDQGEGRYVSVRGLSPDLNSSSVNGVRLPSPESDVRSVALDVLSSDSIEAIEVKKTLTPDMDGDTIGASIEIKTVSAFNRKRDLLSVSVEGSYNHLRDQFTPKAALDFSKRITDNFGIAGGISYYERKFSTDNIEASGWNTTGGITSADTLEYRDYDVQRKRLSASLSFDWRPSDTTTLYLRGIYNQFDDHEYRARTTFKLGDPSAGTSNSAFFDDADERIEVRRDLKDRFEGQKIRSVAFGGETAFDAWKFTYQASWAKSTELEDFSVDPTRFRARFTNNGVKVLFNYGDEMRPAYYVTGNTARFFDPTRYTFNVLDLTDLSDSRDEEWAAKLDVARTLAMGNGELTVQAGVKSRWRTKSYNNETLSYDKYNGTYTLADVLGSQSYGLADISPVPSQTGPTDFYLDHTANFVLNDEDTLVNSTTDDYSAKEDILAGYGLLRFDSDMLRVIAGVRMEHTHNELSGNFVDQSGAGSCGASICVTPIGFTRNYTDWLPSLNLRFEPQKGLVLRGAVTKSLVRPNLKDLAPRYTLDDSDEADFGNPDLKPYKSWNFDASAEYYYGRDGAVSVNFFHKDIKDFIVDSHITMPGTFGGISYDKATIPINGRSANVTGAEFSFSQLFNFLPAPLDGLLFQFNYTYTDATGTLYDGRKINLPNASKHTFNTVLGYEKGKISLRLAGTYRSKYLDEVGDTVAEDRIVMNHFQLDASARYRVTKGVTVFVDLVNLNNAHYFAYQNFAGARRLLQFEEYKWTAKAGVKVTF